MLGVRANALPLTAATFGDMLKFLRRRARLTQWELGLAVGYSDAQITRLEKNQRLPDLTALAALFVPALGLEDEPQLVTRLMELAAAARRERLTGEDISFTYTRENDSSGAGTRLENGSAANLPFYLTSFIGREQEISDVKQALAGSRLVTLTGPGGSGKTRLAVQVASGLTRAYKDGVWWVELESLREAALVPKAIANALGILEIPNQPLSETLANQLRARQMLLFLDNCEHLVNACAQLSQQLLRTCPQLSILATSREALGLLGETVWSVPKLSLPDDPPPVSIASLLDYESIRLFVERAQAVNAGFALTKQNALPLIQICRQLDGMPLAIELTAVQVKVISIEQIAARLDDRFNLLTRGNQGAVPRHQTLRAAIDWSYDLLSAKEQVLLRRLSVFAGGCSLDAAEAVCATANRRAGTKTKLLASQSARATLVALKSGEVIDLISRLVDKSLVVVEVRNAEARYHLLETIRHYGWEKLEAAGEAKVIQQQHAEYFMALVEAAEPGIQSAHEKLWLDRLEAEHDNVRAALAWGLAEPEAVEIGLRIVGPLLWLWVDRNYLAEGSRWVMAALQAEVQTRPALDLMTYPSRAVWRAKALFSAAALAWWQGDIAASDALIEESVTIYRALGAADKKMLSYALAGWGLIRLLQGRLTEAWALEEESVSLIRELNDPYALGHTLCCFGRVAIAQEDYPAAESAFEEDLAICRSFGVRPYAGTGTALQYLGLIAFRRGDYAAAHMLLKESSDLLRESGMEFYLTEALLALGQVLRCQGNYPGARTTLQECIALCQETGIKHIIFEALAGLGGTVVAEAPAERSSATIERLGPAITLLAALPALQNSGGYPPSQDNQAGYDRDVAAARALLDETAFATAWAAGQRMTLDETIAYALERLS